MEPKLIQMFLIVILSGGAGSLLALLPMIFRKQGGSSGYGTTAGIGFLIGASLGGLLGIFAVLLGQV